MPMKILMGLNMILKIMVQSKFYYLLKVNNKIKLIFICIDVSLFIFS